MRFGILGMGTALPQHSIETEAALAYAQEYNCESDDQRRKLNLLYRKIGIERRHLAVMDHPVDHEDSLNFFPPPNGSFKRGPSIADRMEQYETKALPLAYEAASNALERAEVLRRPPDSIWSGFLPASS